MKTMLNDETPTNFCVYILNDDVIRFTGIICVYWYLSVFIVESAAAVASKNLISRSLPHHEKSTANFDNTKIRHLNI